MMDGIPVIELIVCREPQPSTGAMRARSRELIGRRAYPDRIDGSLKLFRE